MIVELINNMQGNHASSYIIIILLKGLHEYADDEKRKENPPVAATPLYHSLHKEMVALKYIGMLF